MFKFHKIKTILRLGLPKEEPIIEEPISPTTTTIEIDWARFIEEWKRLNEQGGLPEIDHPNPTPQIPIYPNPYSPYQPTIPNPYQPNQLPTTTPINPYYPYSPTTQPLTDPYIYPRWTDGNIIYRTYSANTINIDVSKLLTTNQLNYEQQKI